MASGVLAVSHAESGELARIASASPQFDAKHLPMKKLTVLALLCFAFVARAEPPASWFKPVDPVRVVGNIYYVGTEELGAYLIADENGLLLLDVPEQRNAELVLRNIRTLGFDPKRLKILLASHAHRDHIGGFADVKEATGAKVYLSAADAELAARGGKGDFAFGDTIPYPPVKADTLVKDGDVVRLGDIAMTAVLTPGHTRGCTTWRTTVVENDKPLDVIFLCSVTAPGYKLVGNEQYPTILDDYRMSFAKLKKLDPDVFLANHGGFFDLTTKLAKSRAGGANPFIARGEFKTYLERAWKDLESAAAKQK
jgi:metallo-beta-lactamase class B